MTRKELLVAGLAFTLASVVLTYPVAAQIARALPSDLTDTLLNTWTLAWDADRFRHGFSGLWDAPIFFPYRHTLAFSENLLGIAIFVAPLEWLSADPILSYNVAFVFEFALAGVAMYLLARELTGNRAAAAVAGVLRVLSVSHGADRARADGRDRVDAGRALGTAPLFLDAPASLAGGVRRRLDSADAVEHVRRLFHGAARVRHRCAPTGA